MSLLTIEEPKSCERYALWNFAHPLWRLGFRPFYLCAALFAAISLPLWIARYYGLLPAFPHVGMNWHMHEMVFGMGIAVIVGFLYTAGRNWTGLWTPRGAHLAALVALWLAGRLAMLAAPTLVAAIIDVLFLPFAIWPFYRVLQRSGNKRNLVLAGLLCLLMAANLLFHAALLGWIALAPTQPIEAAILIIVMIESVIGARVIPMFTANGAPGTKVVVRVWRERLALALVVGASLAWTFDAPAALSAVLSSAAALVLLMRLAGWQPQRTLRVPLLWILHVSYGWIAIGFFLLVLTALNLVSESAAFHALAVGSMAGLILGMMTRTTLGHTGRPLKAGAAEFFIYALIQIGALARVLAALDGVGMRDTALIVATLCWTLAFLLYAIIYAPYLSRPRVDGREG